MTEYANFTDDHVPAARPHRGPVPECVLRQHGDQRATVSENATAWITSSVTVEVRE